MIRTVSGCVGCGLVPCMHCKAKELICDECGSEAEVLYYGKDDDQLCEECFLTECLENAKTVDPYEDGE